jgi:hypothetical protein
MCSVLGATVGAAMGVGDQIRSLQTRTVNQRQRAVNLAWREWATDAIHVESITTGFVPDDREGFALISACVGATLAFHAERGERFSEFYVYQGDKRSGSGFFDSNVTAADIPYLFAALAARGFDGHVASSDPDAALAATGRWMVLVPHQYDFVTPEIHALMTGTTLENEKR